MKFRQKLFFLFTGASVLNFKNLFQRKTCPWFSSFFLGLLYVVRNRILLPIVFCINLLRRLRHSFGIRPGARKLASCFFRSHWCELLICRVSFNFCASVITAAFRSPLNILPGSPARLLNRSFLRLGLDKFCSADHIAHSLAQGFRIHRLKQGVSKAAVCQKIPLAVIQSDGQNLAAGNSCLRSNLRKFGHHVCCGRQSVTALGQQQHSRISLMPAQSLMLTGGLAQTARQIAQHTHQFTSLPGIFGHNDYMGQSIAWQFVSAVFQRLKMQ